MPGYFLGCVPFTRVGRVFFEICVLPSRALSSSSAAADVYNRRVITTRPEDAEFLKCPITPLGSSLVPVSRGPSSKSVFFYHEQDAPFKLMALSFFL